MAYGPQDIRQNPLIASNTDAAYGSSVKQFNDLQGGIDASRQAAMQALKSQQGVNAALPGQLGAAKSAGMNAIRSNNANAIGAAGSRAAMQGAGGYGALLQAGKQGGIDSAQFGVNATIDAAKTMMGANQQLGQLGENVRQTVEGGYNALQDAGGSIEAIRGEQLAEAKSAMAQIFKDLDGIYNTDAEENEYRARMQALIASATDPVVRNELLALKMEYDRQFFGLGEYTGAGVSRSV